MHASCKSPSAARSFDLHQGGVREFLKRGVGMGKAAPAGGQLWEGALRRPTGSRREAVGERF